MMIPEFYLYILLAGMSAICVCVFLLSYRIDVALRALFNEKQNYIDAAHDIIKKDKELERPYSIEAQEILHDLTAHGKAVLLVQKIGMDEILLRPKRGE